jgi:hypothetical protein
MSMDPWLDRLGRALSSRTEILCVCVCVCPTWQALGAQACGVNIVQDCAGLGAWPSGTEIVCVYISDAAGLGAWPSRAEILQGCASLGGHGLVKIVNVCGSLTLSAHPTEILRV